MAISISKRARADGTVRYRAQVRVLGHEARSNTFSTRKAAKTWAEKEQDRLRDLRPGVDPSATLGDAIDRYLREDVPKLADHKARTAHLEWWRGELGTVRLVDLTAAAISEKLYKLEQTPTTKGNRKVKRAPGTINRYHASLSALLKVAAKRWHWIPENPARGVMRHTESRGRNRWLNDDERKALLAACRASRWPGLRPLVLLALATGARQGELLWLTWDRVDLKAGTAYLAETKNSDPRTLYIRGPALEALKEWGKVRRLDSPLVFPAAKAKRRQDGKPVNPEPRPFEFRKHWERAVQDAGLVDFRFHDLRHSAASYLAMNGASLVEIAAVLGHRTMQMVKRYSHLADEHTASVVERMVAARLGDE